MQGTGATEGQSGETQRMGKLGAEKLIQRSPAATLKDPQIVGCVMERNKDVLFPIPRSSYSRTCPLLVPGH